MAFVQQQPGPSAIGPISGRFPEDAVLVLFSAYHAHKRTLPGLPRTNKSAQHLNKKGRNLIPAYHLSAS